MISGLDVSWKIVEISLSKALSTSDMEAEEMSS
jgi:hypothetical protein